MPAKQVVIIGAGGHAKVVIDILKSDPTVRIVGCIAPQPGGDVLGFPIVGDDSALQELYEQGVAHAFVAIGDNRLRSQLAHKAESIGFQLINAVSPFSYIADSAVLGTGIAVMPGAVINASTRIGNRSIINTRASVDHDGVIGHACHIAPGSILSGFVNVGDGSFLGTGTVVKDGIAIGSWSVLGAGSVVVRDIPDHCLAMGVPAKVVKSLV